MLLILACHASNPNTPSGPASAVDHGAATKNMIAAARNRVRLIALILSTNPLQVTLLRLPL
jgi:hypothetical protein